ncbi:MAG TPA: DUF5011 domain-containing protein, partial [Mollicutes bacterium]|nr:DUF5011 domain-containing protein [Mollicutes bacterium]
MKVNLKSKKGFTLIELIATIVVLGIILAITIPAIMGIVRKSTIAAFEKDAKMVLKAIDYKKLNQPDFNPETLNQANINELLNLSDENYVNLNIYIEDNVPLITIVGKNKWEGFVACGSFRDMKVVDSTKDCSTDVTPPVITVLGDNPYNMYVGETYSDAGATALDDRDGDITDKIIKTGTVSPNVPGVYTITYTVSDIAMNETTETRTINVIDTESPMISFNPNGNTAYSKERTLTLTVTDVGGLNNDTLKYVWTTSTTEPTEEDFTNSFISGNTITTPSGVSGSYYLWATATDISDNTTTTRSNVFNLDNEKPVITINGNSNITINKGSPYSDEGATATDNIDTTVTVTATGSVNPNIVGTYTITYNATDSAGNTATPVVRTVNVVDVSAPVITILGSNPVTIEVKSSYSDAGATAVDDVDGDVTSKITTTGTVNPNALGTYTITYTVKDTSGNTATATRTVKVVDTTKPTV